MNKLIIDTLKLLGVPIEFQTYSGDETTYITFFNMLEDVASYADNKETSLGYHIQVDVWSSGNYGALVDSVLETLKQAGFRRKYVTELYESDTEIYHKVIRVFYLKQI